MAAIGLICTISIVMNIFLATTTIKQHNKLSDAKVMKIDSLKQMTESLQKDTIHLNSKLRDIEKAIYSLEKDSINQSVIERLKKEIKLQ